MAKRRLSVSLNRGHAMEVTRVSIGKKRLVYLILAEKPLKYPWGRSRVAYIGTTKKGVGRIAQSVAARAQDVLSLHGVRKFHVRIVTCSRRQAVKTWEKLERALILLFRHKYGAVPKCNTIGKRTRFKDEFNYFKRERLENILEAVAE